MKIKDGIKFVIGIYIGKSIWRAFKLLYSMFEEWFNEKVDPDELKKIDDYFAHHKKRIGL